MRPKIELTVHPYTNSLWSIFKDYHYLNRRLNFACESFVAILDKKPVAFIALVHSPYKQQYWRVSRLVVLPDYQGIGIGTNLLNTVAEFWTQKTQKNLSIVTSNPQLKNLHKHSNWLLKNIGHKSSGSAYKRRRHLAPSSSANRQTFSFKYPYKAHAVFFPELV